MNVQQSRWRALIYVGPAVILLFTLMVYPSLDTIRLSWMDKQGEEFVGTENYDYALTSDRMVEAFKNNFTWLTLFTVGTVGLGLIIATLIDRVKYETLVKGIIFLPMAISFVGAGVIWKFVYDHNPPGTPLQPSEQIGLMNAALVSLDPDQTLRDGLLALQNEGIPIEIEDVSDAVSAYERDQLNDAVTEGDLTQEEVDSLLPLLPETMSNFLDGEWPPEEQAWQGKAGWSRVAIDAINERLATWPERDGRIICDVLPYACVYAIEDVEAEALEQAVDDGRLTQERADTLEDTVRDAALVYVTDGRVPKGTDWQTVRQWDEVIASVDSINVRAINNSLDTGVEPVDWIREPFVNNLALIAVGIWIWTGFCTVVFSASLKGIPAELLEAARVDGANEIQVFFKIILPLLMPTITVLTTTMIITVLKVFDIVYVMTAGNFGTEVIANRMYFEMYGGSREYGRASAIAVILMLLIVPILIYNIYQFRKQEARQ